MGGFIYATVYYILLKIGYRYLCVCYFIGKFFVLIYFLYTVSFFSKSLGPVGQSNIEAEKRIGSRTAKQKSFLKRHKTHVRSNQQSRSPLYLFFYFQSVRPHFFYFKKRKFDVVFKLMHTLHTHEASIQTVRRIFHVMAKKVNKEILRNTFFRETA